METCIFCRVAEGKAPARVVLSDDEVIAFHDTNPQAPTHVLVIPRRHIGSLDSAGPSDRVLLGRLLLACAEVARELGVAERGYRVVTNIGPAAGQTVPHIHLHVLGGRRLGWPPG